MSDTATEISPATLIAQLSTRLEDYLRKIPSDDAAYELAASFRQQLADLSECGGITRDNAAQLLQEIRALFRCLESRRASTSRLARLRRKSLEAQLGKGQRSAEGYGPTGARRKPS